MQQWPVIIGRKGNWVFVMMRLLLGVIIGGLLGYGVYRYIGCSSGACPITANPWISTLFGIAIGTILAQRR